MKKKYAFDLLDSDINNISEASIVKDTGIYSERIKEIVLPAISKKSTVKFRKKTVLSIIAAAAAIAVIGTVSVGAAGGFNNAFGEYFAGESANGVFSGKDVSVSSDKVDIDFYGIAGDDDQVMALMTLKNKDGSAFVQDTENVFIDRDTTDLSERESVTRSKSLWSSLTSRGSFETGSVQYKFDDKNTIRALVEYYENSGNIKGERLNVSDSRVFAYHPDKVIYTPKSGDGYSTMTDDGNGYQWQYDDRIFNKLEKEYAGKLRNDQVIRLSENGDSIIIATKTEIKLDYELGVTLNYKSTNRTIDEANGKTFKIGKSDWTVNNIEAKSFSIELSAHTWELKHEEGFDFDNMEKWSAETWEKYNEYIDNLLSGKMEITLKDGRKIDTEHRNLGSVGGNSIGKNYGEFTQSYNYYENGKLVAIDPADIVSITYEGQKII